MTRSVLWAMATEDERCAYHPHRHAVGRYASKPLCSPCAKQLGAVLNGTNHRRVQPPVRLPAHAAISAHRREHVTGGHDAPTAQQRRLLGTTG